MKIKFLPQERGTTFFVNEREGNDNNSGLSVEEALATRGAAISKCKAPQGDYVFWVEKEVMKAMPTHEKMHPTPKKGKKTKKGKK